MGNVSINTVDYDKEMRDIGDKWEDVYTFNDSKYDLNLEDI
jgi:hypothetical protein